MTATVRHISAVIAGIAAAALCQVQTLVLWQVLYVPLAPSAVRYSMQQGLVDRYFGATVATACASVVVLLVIGVWLLWRWREHRLETASLYAAVSSMVMVRIAWSFPAFRHSAHLSWTLLYVVALAGLSTVIAWSLVTTYDRRPADL
jgi:hypothetical protein